MGLIKLTFDGALNTAKQDAVFNHFITSGSNGIFAHIGNEIRGTISNSKIVFQDGYAQAIGRRVFVENNTSVDIRLDSTANGVVVIRFDTNNDEATIEKKEIAGTGNVYPSLTQTATITEGGIFELPIFYYKKTASSLTKSTDRSVLPLMTEGDDFEYLSNRLDDVDTTVNNKIDSKVMEINKKIDNQKQTLRTDLVPQYSSSTSSNGITYTFHIPVVYPYYLISFYMCGTYITLPSAAISSSYGTNIYYRYLGVDYTCEVYFQSSRVLKIKTGKKEHAINKGIYISY